MPPSANKVYFCVLYGSQQTAIISLYNINWLVFITETECFYCAVRTKALNKIHVKIGLYEGLVCPLLQE
jgi:hypothetical protein